jgi:hypothetical protein
MATKKLREKQNEEYLVRVAKKHDGKAMKFTSPSRRSVPDRVCVIPCFDPCVQFVEMKPEGEDATDAQAREHKRIRDAGGIVHVLDTKRLVDDLFFFNCTNPDHG